jgi:hypothetical protein
MVEGNHAQLGLSYPDHLLTNIDSKRTNHSAAERERRNRMNNALQEMPKLLLQGNCPGVPEINGSTIVVDREGSDSNSCGGRTDSIQIRSKFSTVERAIEYIQALQKELVESRPG